MFFPVLVWFLRMSSTRKCSHCGNMGHNSRACTPDSSPRRSLKLFGVELQVSSISSSSSSSHSSFASRSSSSLLSSVYDNCMKKSLSTDCLSSKPPAPAASPSPLVASRPAGDDKVANGYHSDGPVGRPRERKKGNLELALSSAAFHFAKLENVFRVFPSS